MGRGEGGGSCDDNHHHLFLLSEDVLIQIFLLLPVISLLRFKSVCKSWRAIIESPFFINLHLAVTSSTLWPSKLGGSSLLFDKYFSENHYGEIYDFDLVQKKGIIFTLSGGIIFTLSGELFEVFEDLGKPSIGIDEMSSTELSISPGSLPESSVEFSVVGCLNGIICLHDEVTRYVALWNPAIKQTRILSKPSNLLGNPNCCTYDDDGYYYADDFVMFGIDVKTMDYKVLLITTIIPAPTNWGSHDDDGDQVVMESLHPRRVHVYNLSTDSWRCIDTTTMSNEKILQNVTIYTARPNLCIRRHEGIYLNGTYIFMANCWIEGQEEICQMFFILSFDFTEEIFTNIEPPYDWRKRTCDEDPYFIPFGEKLALVDAKQDSSYYAYEYTIWVLNDQHGVKGGFWTKFYTIGPDTDIVTADFELKCITNDGEFAIVCEKRGLGEKWELQLYNLITRETKDIQLHCPLTVPDFNIYRPSLVPIVGGNGAAHN